MGLKEDSAFWINICSKDIFPLFTCLQNQLPLNPPMAVRRALPHLKVEKDWSDWLQVSLPEDSKTLPENFAEIVENEMKNFAIKLGRRRFEAVYWQAAPLEEWNGLQVIKMNQIAPVTVIETVANRVRCQYDDRCLKIDQNSKVFSSIWLTMPSPYFHDLGFSKSIGHSLMIGNVERSEAIATEASDLDEVDGFQIGDRLEVNFDYFRISEFVRNFI